MLLLLILLVLFDRTVACQLVCPLSGGIIFTFSGLCLSQLGGSCLPKRQPKIISHQVVFYDVNGTQVSQT